MTLQQFIAGASILSLPLMLAAVKPACPPKLEIGQTYAEVKAGPCPDIAKRANYREANIVQYYCPSLSVQVIGDVTTGRMVGFVKIDYVPAGSNNVVR